MSDTAERELKSREAQRYGRLLRMLRSTLQSYPKAKLLHGRGGFGVSLDAKSSLFIRFSGQLPPADLRDLLALFVTWLAVDPNRLVDTEDTDEYSGVSRLEIEEQSYSNGWRA